MSSLSPECCGGPLHTRFLSLLIRSFRKPSRPAGSVMDVRDARVNMTAPTACHWSWLMRRRHGGHTSVTFKPCSVAFFCQIVAEDASHTFQVQAARATTGPSPSPATPLSRGLVRIRQAAGGMAAGAGGATAVLPSGLTPTLLLPGSPRPGLKSIFRGLRSVPTCCGLVCRAVARPLPVRAV